jgi:basic amino acid/polyamine antiporter, APA family
VLTLLMTVILVIGIRESARFNNVIVFIKLAIIFLVIGVGFKYVNTANWQPFIPENTGKFGEFGWSGVLRGAGVIFFAYIGFDAVSTAAQEARNPQRDMPIGILGSLFVCTILYILMALVMTGMVHYSKLNDPAPILVAVQAAGPSLAWLRYAVEIGSLAGLASVVLVMLMGQPRVFFSMARDGLLPPVFAKVHPKYKTPYITTILTGTIAAIVAGLFPIGLLGQLVSIGTLLAFVIVCAGVWILRVRSPEIPRAFKTPLVPLVPILGILSCFGLMAGLPLDTWLRLLLWLGLGLLVYFVYGKSHSHIGRGGTGHHMGS